MMCRPVPLMLVALTTALAAPATMYDDYPVVVPQKRAALVLDRLLIALQKALHDSPPRYERPIVEGPRTAALRIADDEMTGASAGDERNEWLGPEDLRVAPLRVPAHDYSDMTGLQRRGQSGGAPGVRGRVLRCYFNAITCF
ncbi:uncharacterized protein LOC114360724 isoform X1 [Ostrinia furnacalis]|uniref:uncharacterized protein LOC114360724 isoform X1 n=1 Tax=Ostrinia furnacalis TaxID=93504 RepID=UPI00103DEF43|nr:uncharacterized protein LOC114360724 isoform X1 [Ostrinia furnacalis]